MHANAMNWNSSRKMWEADEVIQETIAAAKGGSKDAGRAESIFT